MPDIDVIDLSHHNVIPDTLIAARAAGVRGLIHKASEGTQFTDSKFHARATLASDAGMLFGAYHFLRPGKITQQADHFLKTIDNQLDDELLVACDYEVDGIALHEVDDWMDHVEIRTGRSCVLYSGHSVKDAIRRGENPVDLQERRLWLAQYSKAPVVPRGWNGYWLWQWSDASAAVPGVTPPVDVNDFSRSTGELEAEWSGRVKKPLPPEPEGLVVRVIAPEGVEIVVERRGY